MRNSQDIYDELSIALRQGSKKKVGDIFFQIEYLNLSKNQFDDKLMDIIIDTLSKFKEFKEGVIEKVILFLGSDFKKASESQSIEIYEKLKEISFGNADLSLKIIIGDLIGHKYSTENALGFCNFLISKNGCIKEDPEIKSIVMAVYYWLRAKESEFSKSQKSSYEKILNFLNHKF